MNVKCRTVSTWLKVCYYYELWLAWDGHGASWVDTTDEAGTASTCEPSDSTRHFPEAPQEPRAGHCSQVRGAGGLRRKPQKGEQRV